LNGVIGWTRSKFCPPVRKTFVIIVPKEISMTNNQRFIAELVVLLSVGAAVWVKAIPKRVTSDVLRTKRLEVVGQNGKARVVISVDENESPYVRLLDKHGKERIHIELSAGDFPRLSLIDANSSAGVSLDVTNSDAGMYIFGHEAPTPEGIFKRGIGLGVYKSNEASLHFFDSHTSPNGHVSGNESHINLGVAQDEYYFSLSGRQTQSRYNVKVPQKGQASSEIYDINNKLIWSAPTKPGE
jgi:hypothetical protein